MANALTIGRLLLIPVVFRLILIGSPVAIAIFGLAALTDFFDGMLARRANNVTELGRILDPLVDRLFILSMVLALYIKYQIPPFWALVLLLARDVIILTGSAWVKWQGKKIEVIFLGKVATAVLLVSMLALVAQVDFGIWIFYFGLALYIGSGFIYLASGMKLLEP